MEKFKYICPRDGYLVDVKSVDIDKSMLIVCEHPTTGETLKMYNAFAKFGRDLLEVDNIDKSRRWLEVSDDPNGGIIDWRRWRDREPENYGILEGVNILVYEDGSSPQIYEFNRREDVALFINVTQTDNGMDGEYYE